jgi:hypothetical protein
VWIPAGHGCFCVPLDCSRFWLLPRVP